MMKVETETTRVRRPVGSDANVAAHQRWQQAAEAAGMPVEAERVDEPEHGETCAICGEPWVCSFYRALWNRPV